MGIVLLLLFAILAPAEERPTFQAGVTLVKVDVQVMRHGRPLAGLRRDDFVLTDDGRRQAITYFGRETEPVWVVFLLDVSGSMTRYLRQMAAASRQALLALQPADQAAVMLFGRRTRVEQTFTSDREALAREIGTAVHERGLGAATRINAAVLDAAGYLRESAAGKPGRRAIVILTDNGGMNYRLPDRLVVRTLWAADAVFNAIVVGKAHPPARPRNRRGLNPDFTPSDVFALARATGGEVIRARRAGRAFTRLMAGIRTRYSLHFPAPPSRPGSYHRIRVELAPAAARRYGKVTLRARTGYYY